MTYENGEFVPWTKRDQSHPNWGQEQEDRTSHRQFTVTALSSQIRRAFKIGLRKGEFDNNGDDLMVIYRHLVKVLWKNRPDLILKMYDEIRPKVEQHFKERNRQLNKTLK